ncbi:MAG: class I SAM-dependent methyltransferase [Acetobacteraceae bacterium]|nr:class I SAM-dependent methyltransferase [Acetobacteraceae bacterium]
MSDAERFHREQIEYWNSAGGERWVTQQAHTDAMLVPITERAIAHAGVAKGERVIDIGCGCGATTMALADRVGREGHVTGLDVSAPMLAAARRRGSGRSNITWLEGDAAAVPLPEAAADLLFSRFGVMFFGDPVRAFAHLRRSLRPGGRLAFVCWRDFDENKWMKVPLTAAYQHVPKMPKLAPEEPGPFAFADAARIAAILDGSGFATARIVPFDLQLDIADGGGLDRACRLAVEIGPASRALRDYPEAKPAVVATLQDKLRPYLRGDTVPLAAAVWLVSATAPAD